jgi:SRSO17 transposase
MLLDAGRDREDIGVEDDVLGREADLVDQQVIGALADLDLARLRVGLPLSSKAITTTAAP